MNAFTLYKYRVINDRALYALRSGHMWFSRPIKLNDTLEVPASLHDFASPGGTTKVLRLADLYVK